MEEKKNSLILVIIKIILLVLGFAAMVGFIAHFVMGIRDSLFADDIITAQDRIAGAYQFIRMLLCGLIALAFFIPTIFLKVDIIPEKLKNFFKKKEFKEE